MVRRFYVYAYFDPDGVPFYIGKGEGDRAIEHRCPYNARCRTSFHQELHTFRQRGCDLRPTRLVECLTESEACAWEIGLIALIGRRDLGRGPLCNLTDGGKGSRGRRLRHTEETKRKIADAHRGRRLSEEHKCKLRGRTIRDDTRRLLSDANRRRIKKDGGVNYLRGKWQVMFRRKYVGRYPTYDEALEARRTAETLDSQCL
jgi:hypothetical protein